MSYSIPDTVTTKGPFQPMRFEATVEECIVTHGEIPKDLAGGFYRTGPCWKRPTKQGTTPLLAMDGMVQGLVFDNGRADFRNRWVRTPKYCWKRNTAVACSSTPTVDSATTGTTATARWCAPRRTRTPRRAPAASTSSRSPATSWSSGEFGRCPTDHRPDHLGDQGHRALGAGPVQGTA